jgi:cytochrome c-type biogenesis protein
VIGFDLLALIPSAFLAGVLMFLAPCTLPVVPGYLAFIAGVPEDATQVRGARKHIVWNALAFVIGFSIIFTLLGTFAGLIGAFIGPWKDLLGRAAGVILIIFGLTMLGALRIPVLSATASIPLPRFIKLGRWESSLLIGMLFACGWTPCIGPILGSILTISLLASDPSVLFEGALLLGVFSLGLAVPFMLTAFFLDRASVALSHLTLLVKFLSLVGGISLFTIGALMVFGELGTFSAWGLQFFNQLYEPLLKYM